MQLNTPRDLILSDPLLLNDWLAVAWSSAVPQGELLPVRVLGRDLVLWRGDSGGTCASTAARSSRSGQDFPQRKLRMRRLPVPWLGIRRIRIASAFPRTRISVRQCEHAWILSRCARSTAWCGSVSGGNVVVPRGRIGRFPGCPAGPYQFHAQGPRVIENFLDVAHLPCAHAGLLGDSEHAEIGDYTVKATSAGTWSAVRSGSRTGWYGPRGSSSLHLLG